MTPLAARLTELRLALMLLTRLPMGRLRDPVPPLSAAAWAYPLVGLVVGLAGWAAQALALTLGLAPGLGALAALGAMALLTGGLHLDGLADYADGVGGGRDRTRVLEIMRDSRIGSYGVVALIFALGAAAVALATGPGGMPLAAFLLAGTASRLAMLVLLLALPPARADGLGQAAAGTARLAWLPGAVVVAGVAVWTGPQAFVALLLAVLIAATIARQCLRRIGGQTGDVLGATQVMTEVAVFTAASVWLLP
ncbi:cobalamin-5'-phosphate synthase [Loktanella fryxellensis]|uniref:Adenosylcobinamide-GDP ribazoletransferase n=1 Tax=Loktanella fryxellensis TaxID=245187 RepID=A0A1H8C982_9RHOB|nr:adenosylcobinamide-GDP ribazoletransferase [Loktanella fryxellensis]SEM91615.1 cobalamin-5'-phosphate synthase [Loktanella fryxellensis]